MAKDFDWRRVHCGAKPDSVAAIREAALRRFAVQGVAATALREIAREAGVSVGLVQHRFGTKEGLVEAVDQYVLDLVQNRLAFGASDNLDLDDAAEESVDDTGGRVRELIAEYPLVVDYLARAMVDDTATGARAFDLLFAIGRKRWEGRAARDQLHPDIEDTTWAALNPLLLTLGTILLRRHIERQLPEPFLEPAQLQRWKASVSGLLRHG